VQCPPDDTLAPSDSLFVQLDDENSCHLPPSLPPRLSETDPSQELLPLPPEPSLPPTSSTPTTDTPNRHLWLRERRVLSSGRRWRRKTRVLRRISRPSLIGVIRLICEYTRAFRSFSSLSGEDARTRNWRADSGFAFLSTMISRMDKVGLSLEAGGQVPLWLHGSDIGSSQLPSSGMEVS